MKTYFLKSMTALLLTLIMLVCSVSVVPIVTTAEESISTTKTPAQLEKQRADLVEKLTAESVLFNYIDREAFVAAKHVERIEGVESTNSYMFKNADGSQTLYMLAEDIKYQNASGEWVEKDLTPKAGVNGYTVSAGTFSLEFPSSVADGVTLKSAPGAVTLTPVGSAGRSVIQSSGRIAYQSAFSNNCILVYTPTMNGFKEDIVLTRYAGQNSFTFTVDAPNLTLFSDKNGTFLAETVNSAERFVFGDVWVYDTVGNFTRGTLRCTTVADGEYTVTVTAPKEFLTATTTQYPVAIDPSLTVKRTGEVEAIEEATVYAGIPNLNANSWVYCDIGTASSSGYGISETLVKLPGLTTSSKYMDLYPTLITSAKFYIKDSSGNAAANIRLHPMLTAWTESTVTYNTKGSYDSNTVVTASLPRNNWANFDITNMVRNWREDIAQQGANYVDKGFILVAANPQVTKQFYSSEISNTNNRPYVVMNYYASIDISDTTNGHMVIVKGTEKQLAITTNPSDEPCTVEWSTGSSSIAGVANGVLTGNAVGNTTLTATARFDDDTTATKTVYLHVVPFESGNYFVRSNTKVVSPYHGSPGDGSTGSETVRVDSFLCYNEENEISLTGDVSGARSDIHSGQWRFTLQYDYLGFYTISPFNRDVYLKGVNSNGVVSVNTATGIGNAAKWKITETGDSVYVITNKVFSDYKLLKHYNGDSCSLKLSQTYNEFEDDRWQIFKPVYTISSYYDPTWLIDKDNTAVKPGLLTGASNTIGFAKFVYKELFGIEIVGGESSELYADCIASKCLHGYNEPCDSGCANSCELTTDGAGHHKNTSVILHYLRKHEKKENGINVLWSDLDQNAKICTAASGSHELVPNGMRGVSNLGQPGVYILRLRDYTYEGTDLTLEETMAALLVHELAHNFGLGDPEGRDRSRQCVMDELCKIKTAYGAYMTYCSAPTGQNKENAVAALKGVFCLDCYNKLMASSKEAFFAPYYGAPLEYIER